MAYQPEDPTGATYPTGVYQLQSTDPVQGAASGDSSPHGVSNQPLLDLANRTGFLSRAVTALQALVATLSPLNSPFFTGTPQAPIPGATDNSQAIPTTSWVQNLIATLLAPITAITGAFAGSLSTNGWQRFPGGLIIQWGANVFPTGSTTSGYWPSFCCYASSASGATFVADTLTGDAPTQVPFNVSVPFFYFAIGF
jgi:hypothetical protein